MILMMTCNTVDQYEICTNGCKHGNSNIKKKHLCASHGTLAGIILLEYFRIRLSSSVYISRINCTDIKYRGIQPSLMISCDKLNEQ